MKEAAPSAVVSEPTKGVVGMVRALGIVFGAVFAAVALFGASPVLAQGTWGWPTTGERRVLVPYGATYETGGATRTHHGMDIGVEAEVLAACDGEVSWTGELPSEGGGRVPAVTVVSTDGLKVTYWPLEGVAVRVGQAVHAGEVLAQGVIEGDPSSPGPHLHFSVRREETYLDPASFIAPAATAVVPRPAPEPEPEPVSAARPVPAPLPGSASHPPSPSPATVPLAAGSAVPLRPTSSANASALRMSRVPPAGVGQPLRALSSAPQAGPMGGAVAAVSGAGRSPSTAARFSAPADTRAGRTPAVRRIVHAQRHVRSASTDGRPTPVSEWRRVRDVWGGFGRLLMIPVAALMSLACCAAVIRQVEPPDPSGPALVTDGA